MKRRDYVDFPANSTSIVPGGLDDVIDLSNFALSHSIRSAAEHADRNGGAQKEPGRRVSKSYPVAFM